MNCTKYGLAFPVAPVAVSRNMRLALRLEFEDLQRVGWREMGPLQYPCPPSDAKIDVPLQWSPALPARDAPASSSGTSKVTFRCHNFRRADFVEESLFMF
jgi:hypothetical protein